MTFDEALAFYSTPGPMTELASVPKRALEGLPDDPLDICRVATGVIVHERWTSHYGWDPPAERRPELQIRAASEMVETILSHNHQPLVEKRPVEERLIGNCRDFSTLSCALLRSKGIPARARCGFGTYFQDDRFIDHWIVERWDSVQARWIQVDTQIDDVQRDALGLKFDPSSMPRGEFLNGGEAWQLCRNGEKDPSHFGIFDMWGLWFIRGNVIRDLASLNKIELLPWDGWGVLLEEFKESDVEEISLMDEVAGVCVSGELRLARSFYEREGLKVPGWVIAWGEAAGARVELPQLIESQARA